MTFSLHRTHSCGELKDNNEGESVILNGWVHNWRNHGGIIFIDLRDRYGITQVVFNPQLKLKRLPIKRLFCVMNM